MRYVDITSEMKESMMEGQVMFRMAKIKNKHLKP